MRGRSNEAKRMRVGRTIVAERERIESDSERMQARKKVKRKHTTLVILVLLILVAIGLAIFLGMKELSKEYVVIGDAKEESEPYVVQATIVDEDNRGQISMRVNQYIGELEQAFADLGYKVVKVTLPTGKSRELYVDLEGREAFFKVSMERGAAVIAEDAARMIRYLDGHDIHPTYVDVRVEGKGFYQ